MASNLKRVTATGLVVAGPVRVKSVVIQGGSANSTALVENSSAGGGTAVLGLAAVIGATGLWTAADREGVFFNTGVYVTLAGAGASCSVEYD